MKNVLVLGGLGNMGRRYSCILRSIGINPIQLDTKDDSMMGLEAAVNHSDGIIIATPTNQHVADILDFSTLSIPIMVEKPISPVMSHVEHCIKECQKHKTPLRMVNQYKRLVDERDRGPTVYNYWNHGRDGLAWDCISVIALAKGEITLAETSPVWNCKINGFALDQAKMDPAYVWMIRDWTANPAADYDYIIEAHEKVHEYLRGKR